MLRWCLRLWVLLPLPAWGFSVGVEAYTDETAYVRVIDPQGHTTGVRWNNTDILSENPDASYKQGIPIGYIEGGGKYPFLRQIVFEKALPGEYQVIIEGSGHYRLALWSASGYKLIDRRFPPESAVSGSKTLLFTLNPVGAFTKSDVAN